MPIRSISWPANVRSANDIWIMEISQYLNIDLIHDLALIDLDMYNIYITIIIYEYLHWRQSGVNSAGARRGFSGILLQNTYIYTNLKQIPGDDRKCGGASAPPPKLASMSVYVYRIYIDKSYLFHINHFNQYWNFKIRNDYLTICYSIISGKSSS